ncbi:MAG: SPOR domain-containing protein [Bacteroidota bacterium]|nr:SPOR domain-containing protein [Bacteroidota bacterium]
MKERLEKYISTLLTTHDCVIVPGFGGFLRQKQAARIAGNPSRIFPPGDTVHFNRSLTMNDGLLANTVSRDTSSPYSKAIGEISSIVNRWKHTIEKEKMLELDELGSISLSEESKWVFIPQPGSSMSLSSFGLGAIDLLPLSNDARPAIKELRKAVPVRWERIRRITRAAAIVIVGITIVIAASRYVPEMPPFTRAENQPVIIKKQTPAPEFTEQAGILPELTFEDTNQAIVPSVNFYIIGGSFAKEKNAKRFAEELTHKGYEAKILDTEKGFFRVSYKENADSLAADIELNQIRQKENPAAWLLKW